MSYVRVWIHSVWGTKRREPFLTKEVRSQVESHIHENAREKGIFIDRLGGYPDHLHCLIGLNADSSIAKTIQLLKGESAFWINKERITRSKFEWADEYFAISVSESLLHTVRGYIDNQEKHHRRKTLADEVAELQPGIGSGQR